VRLGRAVGLKRTGVSIARIPPGRESFVYHSHQYEEEWLYILSGRGGAEIDGEEIDVASGVFMAFPTPSVPHHLKNPFDQELVYLMGGENRAMEIAGFPRLGKRMVRNREKIDVYEVSDAKPFGPLETKSNSEINARPNRVQRECKVIQCGAIFMASLAKDTQSTGVPGCCYRQRAWRKRVAMQCFGFERHR
jgi:uncharacterized cupin superfamily protein